LTIFLNPSIPAGHYINRHNQPVFCLSKSVRNASVCRWQSAGEAQSDTCGHQTDTWHITAGLWRWDWRTGSSGTEEHSFWTIPSHAGKTEQLYTSSPGYKAVREKKTSCPTNNVTNSNKQNCAFWYIIFYYFRYMAVLEDTINLPMCGLFLLKFSTLCFDAFSAVTVQYALNHPCRNTTTSTHTSWLFRY
jgi:hypothetical protein